MLRRLLLGQRKRQDNEENKEVILTTPSEQEEKCASDGESDTETEDSDSDSDTIEGSSVCSLDDSLDNDDTTQECKGFKMVDSHDQARDELQLLDDDGNSDEKVISEAEQEKKRREREETENETNETASHNGEVGREKVSEEGHDENENKKAVEILENDRNAPQESKQNIANNINDDKNNRNDDKNNNKNSSSINNNINKNNSNNNRSDTNRRIPRGQSFARKSNAPEKRSSRIPQIQSFTAENEIAPKPCKQVPCLKQTVKQQDRQVRDARERVGSKGFRGETLVKKSQPRHVVTPMLKGKMRNVKDTEKRRIEKKSQKSTDSYDTDASVSKLVKILGIDIGELKDFIKNVKTEQGEKQDKQDHEGLAMDHSTTVAGKGSASREPLGIGGGNSGPSEDVKLGLSKDLEDILKGVGKNKKVVKGERKMDIRRSPDGCHSVESENEGRREGNQEETSSDSGVSETNDQRYMSLNDVIKRKEHLTDEIAELDARILMIEGHRKDLQVVHDLFDLCSDELKDVGRNNVGVPSVQSLKEILNCQIRELTDSELKRKMNGLESIGVPYFTAVQEHVETLRVEINHSLKDDRKCRSKGLQKIRFEYGKVLGMCEGILACVYQQ